MLVVRGLFRGGYIKILKKFHLYIITRSWAFSTSSLAGSFTLLVLGVLVPALLGGGPYSISKESKSSLILLRSSFNFKNIVVSFSFKKIKVVFHFKKISWSTSLFHLHSLVEKGLHNNDHTPRLPNATQFPSVCGVFLLIIIPIYVILF